MKNLFFDVETTGKALMKEGAGHPGQPRVVQMAVVLAKGEEELAVVSLIIRPSGFTIPPESTAIHGIEHDQAMRDGVSIDSALRLFTDLAEAADGFVAHNIAFDHLVMESEFSRMGRVTPFRVGKPLFCTMKAATPVCRLPGPYGYKWPKLSEVYAHAFDEQLVDAHDALVDIRATKRVYDWLMRPARPELVVKPTSFLGPLETQPIGSY